MRSSNATKCIKRVLSTKNNWEDFRTMRTTAFDLKSTTVSPIYLHQTERTDFFTQEDIETPERIECSALAFDDTTFYYAILKDKEIEIYSIPACIAFTSNGIIIGEQALENAKQDSKNTISGISTLLQRNILEPDLDVQVVLNGVEQRYTPSQLFGLLVVGVKQHIEQKYNKSITGSVVILPQEYWQSDAYRQILHKACFNVGVRPKRIITEATCATLGYGVLEKPSFDVEQLISVCVSNNVLKVMSANVESGIVECQESGVQVDFTLQDVKPLVSKVLERVGVATKDVKHVLLSGIDDQQLVETLQSMFSNVKIQHELRHAALIGGIKQASVVIQPLICLIDLTEENLDSIKVPN